MPPVFMRRLSLPIIPCALVITGCTAFKPWGQSRLEGDVSKVQQGAPKAWNALPKVSSDAATGWLSDFSGANLQPLVQQAIAQNHDLRGAAARVTQARAQARIAGADLWPQLGADFGARRSQSASGQRFVGLGQRSNRFTLGADISWELDFWGRVADQRGAAVADAQAAEDDLHAAKLSLAANTVKAAITLAEAEALAAQAGENVKTRRVHLGIVEKQLDRGLDGEKTALDVSLSRADLARAESSLALRERTVDAARRSLEVLLGDYPAGKERGARTLPSISRSVPGGLPSEMLLRRPDLRAAERRLASSLHDESAAKKAFLPSLNITGSAGFSTEDLVFLLDKDSLIWSIAGGVAQRLFEGGRIKANIELAKGRYEEALATYAGSVLTAFREVETAIAAEAFFVEQEHALDQAVTEAERSVKLAAGQYDRGLADILTLLDAQQRAFDARSSLLGAKAQRLRNRADLHLALGGEF